MGPRTYYENVVMQEYHRDLFDVYEAYEVGNQIEVVRYLNSLDERPPNLGGRNNNWRELTVSRNLYNLNSSIFHSKYSI